MNIRLVLLLVLLLPCVGCASSPTRDDATVAETHVEVAAERPGDAVEASPDAESVVPTQEAEVEFASLGDTLRGTVIFPAGEVRARRGVVITHDFGPLGRDGVIDSAFAVELPVEVPVYRAIAEHLAARGFVVLIYDKRSCITGSAPGCTYPRTHVEEAGPMGDALVADAVAAATFLAAREDVADDAVDFVGHGHGAEVATAAATKRPGARVVMLAPTATPLDEIVVWQSKHSQALLDQRIAAVGDTPEADLLKKQRKELATQLARQSEAFEQLRSDAELDSDVLGLSPATWRSYFALHTTYLEALRTGDIEARAVLPEADRNYPPESAERMETILRAQGDEAFVLVTEVTHPLVGIGAQDDPTVVSPIVLEVVTDFLTNL